MQRSFARIVIIASCMCMMACSTLQTIRLSPGAATPTTPSLAINDEVVVSLRNGDKQTIAITSITDDAMDGRIVGSNAVVHIDFANVVQIERPQYDATKSILLAATIVGGFVVAALYYALRLNHDLSDSFHVK